MEQDTHTKILYPHTQGSAVSANMSLKFYLSVIRADINAGPSLDWLEGKKLSLPALLSLQDCLFTFLHIALVL